MIEKLTVFLPYSGNNWTLHIVNELKKSLLVENIFLLAPDKSINGLSDCRTLYVDSLFSLDSIKLISKCAGSNLILLFTKDILIELYPGTLKD